MMSPIAISRDRALNYHEGEMESYHDLALGEWHGKLANDFQMGDLDYESFANALDGINSKTGEKLVSSKAKQKEDRAAIDMTISAAKSYSILLALADASGNSEMKDVLVDAFDKAINRTLDHVEENYTEARIQKNKVRKIHKTGNLLIAKFFHETARPVTDKTTGEILVDPDHHNHNLSMNYTQCEDGKFRSLEAKRIFKDKKKIGGFFRSELAQNLTELGIEVVVTDIKHGFWEIKDISPDLLAEFSQRRKQIEEKAAELRKKFPNMNEAKLMQEATLQSREKKKTITMSREELQSKYISRAAKYVNVNELMTKFQKKIEKAKMHKVENKKVTIQSIQVAQKELSQEPKFHQTKYTLLHKLATQTLGQVRASLIFQTIQNKETKDKQQLKTMHDVVLIQLTKTKLDTKKLFKNINRYQREEILGNAARARSNRDRFIIEFSSLKHRFERENGVANRNDEPIIAAAGTERGRDSGAKFERDDAVATRDDRSNREISWSEAIRIANRGDDRNQYEKGFER